MQITSTLNDAAVLEELGDRLRRARLGRNVTQEQLAEEAGITPPTLNKLEHGKPVQLLTLVRVLRALDMLNGLDAAIPMPGPRPVDQLRQRRRERQRASSSKRQAKAKPAAGQWRWGDEAEDER
ncbi:MAG: helix-turn-helix domain-containing protein [Chloroflexota bacterium]